MYGHLGLAMMHSTPLRNETDFQCLSGAQSLYFFNTRLKTHYFSLAFKQLDIYSTCIFTWQRTIHASHSHIQVIACVKNACSLALIILIITVITLFIRCFDHNEQYTINYLSISSHLWLLIHPAWFSPVACGFRMWICLDKSIDNSILHIYNPNQKTNWKRVPKMKTSIKCDEFSIYTHR